MKILATFFTIVLLSFYYIPARAQLSNATITFSEFIPTLPPNSRYPKILLEDNDNWDAGFREGKSIDGGDVYAIATNGDDVYIAGSFGKVGAVNAHNIARWNTKTRTWSALGTGIEGIATGIAIKDNKVYVAGVLSKAGAVTVSNVAVWDIPTQSWSALGEGITGGLVKCVCVAGNDVYFGGFFTTTFGTSIARWSTTEKAWKPFVSGIDGQIFTLAVHHDILYIGGRIKKAGNLPIVNHIVRYNTATNAWLPMFQGFNNSVTSIVAYGDSIYVGGRFASFVNVPGGTRFGVWNIKSEEWQKFENPTPGEVTSIVVRDHEFYLAGTDYLQKYNRDTGQWSDILGVGFIGSIATLASDSNGIYVGGTFGGISSLVAGSIAYRTSGGNSWLDVGGGVSKGLVYVQALAVSGDRIFVGGSFTKAGGKVVNNIAEWNSSTKEWNPLSKGINGRVYALTVKDGYLYAGGDFTYADTTISNSISRWDIRSGAWSNLGKGIYGSVHALGFSGENLYVGGAFTRANDSSLNNLSVFNTANGTWKPVGKGILGGAYPIVTAIAADDSNNVYIGGKFTQAGDSTMSNITKWNERSEKWNGLDGGVKPFQNALPVGTVSLSGKSVYVGGTFDQVGNALKANNIAEWNSSEGKWKQLGDITQDSNSHVSSIVSANGRLYVGGAFTKAGGKLTKNIAVFDSNNVVWSGFGSGAISYYNQATLNIYGLILAVASGDLSVLQQTQLLSNNDVNAVAVEASGAVANVYAGGLFTEAGGKEALHFGVYVDSLKPSAPLQQSLNVYPNPNTTTEIHAEFDILTPNSAILNVYSALGEVVATVFDQPTQRGRYTIMWNSNELPIGVYYLQLITPTYVLREKFIVVR